MTKGLLLQIAQLGNPIIRQKASEVTTITDTKIQQLIGNLLATVKEVDGVGIAAPQVFESLQLFIVASRPSPRYPDAPDIPPFVVINPTILSQSDIKVSGYEGCLSIPGIRGEVPRAQSMQVRYTNQEGHLEEKELTGFLARIFQHEYDHIQGRVFLDKVKNTSTLMTESEYQKMIKSKEQ